MELVGSSKERNGKIWKRRRAKTRREGKENGRTWKSTLLAAACSERATPAANSETTRKPAR